MYWVIIILAIALTLFLVWASADVGSNVYLKSVCKGAVKDKVVTLTFDDGPHSVKTPEILDILDENNIRATFFVVGENAAKNEEIVELSFSDTSKPMGVATYRTSQELPQQLREALPNIEDLKKLL